MTGAKVEIDQNNEAKYGKNVGSGYGLGLGLGLGLGS